MGRDWKGLAGDQAGMLSQRQLTALDVRRGFVRNQLRARRWAQRTSSVFSTTTGPLSGARKTAPVPGLSTLREDGHHPDLAGLPSTELAELIQELTVQMRAAAAELQFEVADRLRDEIGDLRKSARAKRAPTTKRGADDP